MSINVGRSLLTKKSAKTVHCIPMTKARINLGQVVRRVHVNKEYFILEKDGIPVVGIMDADELEDYLELQDPEIQRQIEKSNEDIRAGRTRPAEELLAKIRIGSSAKAGNSRRHKK
jgi:PHD/YefM family antitoxin component YafN of YafNO toxin-antitoxin module